jgi:hypothetical protein
MQKFTTGQIERLKRDAKQLKKANGLSHHEAQDRIAMQHGHQSWDALMRWNAKTAAVTPVASVLGAPPAPYVEVLRQAAIRFVKTIGPEDIRQLCWSGSLWVQEVDIRKERRRGVRFTVLGVSWDGITRQYARENGMVLLMDLEGMADRYVLEDDEDDDGDPVTPGQNQVMYSERVGRHDLLACLEPYEFEAALEDLQFRMERAEEQQAAALDEAEYFKAPAR